MSESAAEFPSYCAELLGVLGRTRARRMFGGHGFYVDDVFIALSMGDRLYLKTDAQTRPRFEAAGCEPFVYHQDGKPTSLGYWTVPDEAMESPALLLPWARLAMEAGLRARSAKPVARKKAVHKKAAAVTPAPAAPAKTPQTPPTPPTRRRARAGKKR